MSASFELGYLSGYPESLREQVAALLARGTLGQALLSRYPEAHVVKDDRALHAWVYRLRQEALRNSPPLSRVCFDARLQALRNALGTHTAISRVQGGKLRAKREIRVASVFREAPEAFLRMIVAHELAHMKERQHDKAFYQLCCHIEPDYHQLEFDVRAWLCYLESGGAPLWPPAGRPGLHALEDE